MGVEQFLNNIKKSIYLEGELDMNIVFQLQNVEKVYGARGIPVNALDRVNLEVAEAKKVAVVGKSGSGKTTLLNVMSTIDNVSNGKILYCGKRIDDLSQKSASKLRLREFGFIFQKYHLMPTLNVKDNILLPLVFKKMSIDLEYYRELVSILEISSKESEMPNHLSGGEQQRVAIARALISRPKVVFADEPTGNLDTVNGNKVANLLFECVEKYKQTLIYVTHNEELAALADRRLVMQDGKLNDEK